MPYYLTDLVDTGLFRFKPRGWNLSPNWSILKLDKAKVVMWSETPIALPGVFLLANDANARINAAIKAEFASIRGDGETIQDRFGDALADLVMRPPDARWKPLRSSRDGIYRLRMGTQLVWSALDPAGPRRASKQAVDNFNRGAANLNGSTSSDSQFTWTETRGTAWTGNGTQATITGVDDMNSAQTSFVLDTDDMDVQMDVVTLSGAAGVWVGAISRGNGNAFGGAGAGYIGIFENNPDNFGTLYDLEASTSIAQAAINEAAGTILKMTVNGSSFELFQDGVSKVTGTDTSWTGVNRAGIVFGPNDIGDVGTIDNFLMQDVGFGGGRTTKNTRSWTHGVNVGMGHRMPV